MVYKARDTRLDRDVAIKVCASQFSERFEREARAICHGWDISAQGLRIVAFSDFTVETTVRRSASSCCSTSWITPMRYRLASART
jgi:hypothetical protein